MADGLLDGGVILRTGFALGTALLQKRGALSRRYWLALAAHDRAFVKLDVQSVAGFELGIVAQLRPLSPLTILRAPTQRSGYEETGQP